MQEHYPEYIGENRRLFPDETTVLVGFYKDEAHFNWILEHQLYNARTGTRRGAVRLGRALVEARHLLLHATGELQTGRLYQILPGGSQMFSGRDLLKKHYTDVSPDRMAERFIWFIPSLR